MPNSTFTDGAFHDVAEDDFVGRLVEDARNAEHEDGPRIAKHLAKELHIGFPTETGEFGKEEEGDTGGADEVDGKGVEHVAAIQHHEEHDVEHDVGEDE